MISYAQINAVLKKKWSVAKQFHSNTSLSTLSSKYIPYEKWPEKWKTIHYKEYIRSEKTTLIVPRKPLQGSVITSLKNRTSNRESCGKPLSYTRLSQIIYYSCGAKSIPVRTNDTKRFYPSAGARYPVELYIVPHNIQSLGDFSYHYNIKRNHLEKLYQIPNFKKFIKKTIQQDWVFKCSCLIIMTAVFDRTKVKYGDRGYRYCLIESGHIAQNFSLMCSALGVGMCAIGAFSEEKIEKHLDLDRSKESPIYLLSIGNLG